MNRLLFIGTLLLIAGAATAQPIQNSPYSRYALGDPLLTNQLPQQTGMGGLSTAWHDPYHLNLANPASLSFLRTTALETGMYAKYNSLTSASDQTNTWSGNLSHLALGFTLKSPINQVLDRDKSPWQYGMALSLTPMSQVGYKISTRDTLPEGVGVVNNSFEGSGGFYKLSWHGGARYKHTALGASFGWAFGSATYENTTVFVDSTRNYQYVSRDQIGVSGALWKLGFQHDFILQRSENDRDVVTRWVTVGLAGEGRHNLGQNADVLRLRTRGKNSAGNYVDADTLLNLDNADRTLTLPSAFSASVMYVKADKLKIGAQFGLEQWSQYDNESRPETLRNTFSLSGGVEFIPDAISYNRYGKRIRYRAGAYYRQDPRIVNGKNLDDVGITLGMGFPLILPRQQTSFVNAALELGRLGADSPIEETYARISIGFTLNDNSWFYKRRFE